MKKIELEAYSAAQNILTELSAVHVAIPAVLGGVIVGEVWVDDDENPQVAIAVNGDAYYVAGNPAATGQTPESVRALIPDWAYLFVEEPWVPYLSRAWTNPFAVPHPRVRMGYVPGSMLSGPYPALAGFDLVPIDRALFDRNPGSLELLEDHAEGWTSRDAFLDRAIGFCVLRDGQIVSHCVTDSVIGSRCEIGVGTDLAFQRLGLGRAAAAATIAECIRRGVPEIEWHSHAANKGSLAIGKSIGLVELDRHVAQSCSLPAENAGDLAADQCLQLAHHFERAGEQINWCWFHAAGARAQAGDLAGALANIRLLIDSDWDGEADWLEHSWALRVLVGMPEFAALLARKRAAETE